MAFSSGCTRCWDTPPIWARVMLILALALTPSFWVAAQSDFKILSYNVLEGLQQDSLVMEQYQDWVKEIDPDIVAYQEMNKFTQKSLEQFAKRYGHPYAVLSKLDGFPVALSSKYPIVNVQKVVDNMWHAYLYANVNNIHVFVIHFSPFSYEKRQHEMRQILAHAALLPQDEKIIIMGDFNSMSQEDEAYHTPEMVGAMLEREKKQAHIRNLNQGKIDYTVMNAIREAGYKDVFLHKNDSLISTVPTKKYGKPSTRRIDFIWTNPALTERVVSSSIIQDAVTDQISDHYPVLVTLDLEK